MDVKMKRVSVSTHLNLALKAHGLTSFKQLTILKRLKTFGLENREKCIVTLSSFMVCEGDNLILEYFNCLEKSQDFFSA